MEKILISSCLLGSKVRYNGSALSIEENEYNWLSSVFQIVPFCPEVSAGLPTPREPAEINFGDGHSVLKGASSVISENGIDFTRSFIKGAYLALDKCICENIKIAVLTESSPSCGSSYIYNGQFTGVKKVGMGVTSALLIENGVAVYNQNEIEKLRYKYERRT